MNHEQVKTDDDIGEEEILVQRPCKDCVTTSIKYCFFENIYLGVVQKRNRGHQ
jgi:hypothetical protein